MPGEYMRLDPNPIRRIPLKNFAETQLFLSEPIYADSLPVGYVEIFCAFAENPLIFVVEPWNCARLFREERFHFIEHI